ncbi:dynamin family protein [Metabacillus arenae]|uniref:Dynamin family protein n=1 Tax=Metabacillus arenae TaxID=2771434 RepID=A0A926NHD9_9BACI|nr:dynamin family protein [Metabacillus arenae]MBD1381639.1 dynamin family protein [Metabacillus arenae]
MNNLILTSSILPNSIKLYDEFMNRHDTIRANKLLDIIEKVYQKQLYIAFTGHFSAGKSSMINEVVGEHVLPTSPIPTSANIVLLQRGEKKVKITLHNGKTTQIDGEYDIEKIKGYCKQGEEIQKLSIFDNNFQISNHLTIIDTPGIDSTDQAHKLATESTLHTSDYLFYIVDYNHVQSEENFAFVSEMLEKGKNLYFIINQIDKHREEEGDFLTYRTKINSALTQLGLKENHIYYTSLRNKDYPYNELSQVKQLFNAIIKEGQEQIFSLAQQHINGLVEEHLQFIEDQEQFQRNEKVAIEEKLKEEKALLDQTTNQVTNLNEQAERLEKELKNQVQQILKNANIIPFETREKAKRFIESQAPQFKVGLFFSQKKTEQEKNHRADRLLEDLAAHTKANIDWHMTNLFMNKYQSSGVKDEEIINIIQSFKTEIDQKLLQTTIKKGASFTDQYVMTYSTDISEAIKQRAREQTNNLIHTFIKQLRESNSLAIEELEEKQHSYKESIQKYEGEMIKINRLLLYQGQLFSVLEKQIEEPFEVKDWLDSVSKKNIEVHEQWSLRESKKVEKEDRPSISIKKDRVVDSDKILKALKNTFKTIQPLEDFQFLSDSLMDRLSSIEQKTFTVALFGAFSAGKSSFANALIGEKVLPSSPTPTTATINKIAPVSSDYPHGTVSIYLKNEEEFLADLNGMILDVSTEAKSLEEAFKKIEKLVNKNQLEERYKVYLQAITEYKSYPSKFVSSTLSEFSTFVAEEDKACYVKEVIIYYDCKLTRQGITLVDTPGADSLHKRHTEVAFSYIKNADAILFLTYYNHPFSKGDQRFLKQLGRVKDAFSLDKMFFIINAIDLASNEEEILDVKNYIDGQLTRQDIRQARIYGVSSLNELFNQKNKNEDDFKVFRKDFTRFIKHDLMEATLLSAENEIAKVSNYLNKIIESSQKKQSEKENEIFHLRNEQQLLLQTIHKNSPEILEKQIKSELAEQVHYIKQRIGFQYPNFFKEAFHPGVFRDQKPTIALDKSVTELIQSIHFEIDQELSALIIRSEQYLKSLLTNWIKEKKEDVIILNSEMILSQPSLTDFSIPTLHVTINELKSSFFKDELKLFKGTKSFFEQNQKQMMSEAVWQKIEELIEKQLALNEENFIISYTSLLTKKMDELVAKFEHEINQMYESMLFSLEKEQDIAGLLHAKNSLSEWIS